MENNREVIEEAIIKASEKRNITPLVLDCGQNSVRYNFDKDKCSIAIRAIGLYDEIINDINKNIKKIDRVVKYINKAQTTKYYEIDL